jgi:hypothetical protein
VLGGVELRRRPPEVGAGEGPVEGLRLARDGLDLDGLAGGRTSAAFPSAGGPRARSPRSPSASARCGGCSGGRRACGRPRRRSWPGVRRGGARASRAGRSSAERCACPRRRGRGQARRTRTSAGTSESGGARPASFRRHRHALCVGISRRRLCRNLWNLAPGEQGIARARQDHTGREHVCAIMVRRPEAAVDPHGPRR